MLIIADGRGVQWIGKLRHLVCITLQSHNVHKFKLFPFLHKIHSCSFQISQLVFLLTFAKYSPTQVLCSQLPQLAVHLAWQSSSSLPVALSNLLPNHQIYIVANSLNINCNIVNRQLAIHPGGQSSSSSLSVAMRNILPIY